MKFRFSLIVAPLLLLQLACGLTSRPSAPAESTPLAYSTNTGQPSELPTTAATQIKTEATQPSPTVIPGEVSNDQLFKLPPEQVGPETLNLTDPVLFDNPLPDYTDAYSDVVSGQDPGGQPNTLSVSISTRYQGQPLQAWSSTSSLFGPDSTSEKAVIDGKFYIFEQGTCKQATAGEPPLSLFSQLPQALTGQAQRGEMGIEINGLITDQYILTAQNFLPNAELELVEIITDGESTSTSTFTVRLSGSGFLYLARAGGFVVRVELNDTALATQDDFFFKPGSEMRSIQVFDRIMTPGGTAAITPPAACQAAEAIKDFVIPRLSDASIVMETDEELIYQTSANVQSVREFYMRELSALGWVLSEDTTLGGMASLTFTLAEQTLSITVMSAGGSTTVQISKY